MDNPTPLSKNGNFLSFFSVKILGAFNDSFIQAGFLAFVTSALLSNSDTHSQNMVFLATGLFMIPVFLFSTMAGEVSDKYDKARLLKCIKLFEIGIAILISASYLLKSEAGMLAGMFFAGLEAAFFTPVRLSIIPFITGKGQLIQANSALESGSYIFKFAGTLAGIVAGATINPYFPLILLLLSSLGFFFASRMPSQKPADPESRVDLFFIRSAFANLKYVKYSRPVCLSLIGLAGAWCITVTFMVQLSQIAKNVYEGGIGQEILNPLFLGPFCLGIGAGAIAASRVYKKEPLNAFLPLSAVIEALLMTDFAFLLWMRSPLTAPVADAATFDNGLALITSYLGTFEGLHLVACIFLITFFAAMFIVPVTACLQEVSPDENRSRIMSANNITAAIFTVIASLTGMLCTFAAGAHNGMVLMAVITAGVCILGSLITVAILPIPIVRSLARKFLSVVYHAKCQGLENFEAVKGKRCVVIANHTSFLDGMLIWAYLHDGLSYAVDTSIASKWYFRLFLALAPRYYTINTQSPMALRSMIREIDNGHMPVIFPEGRITTTGTLMKIYSGSAVVADKGHALVLPVIIDGSQYSIFSRFGQRFHRRPRSRIVVNVMEPYEFSIPDEYRGRARKEKAADIMYDLMAEMKVKASVITGNTIFASFIDAMKTAGLRKVILEDHNRKPITNAGLFIRAMTLGRYFRDHEPEKSVGLLLPNSAASVVVFMALHAANKLPCMLNFSVGAKNLTACCDTVPLRTVYTSRTFINAGFQALDQALRDHSIAVKYLEDLAPEIGLGTKIAAMLDLIRPFTSYFRLAGGKEKSDTPAVVLFTSGSEGLPKGVVLSHRNIETNIVQLQAVLPFGMLDSVFNSMPMFHSFGLTAGTMLPLLSGMKVFMYPSPLHYKNVPLLVYETNSTAIFGTDTFLKGYGEYAHPYDMYSVRFAVSGGEKLKEDTVALWNDKFGIRILEGYGATETAPVISVNTNMFYRRNTAGRPLPGIRTRLEEVPGIASGGRLWVQGDNVMMGYLRADTPGIIDAPRHSWYDTGDIAEIDEKGFIHIKGRAKRFAKVAGEMISLTQVEAVLARLYPETPLAVVAVPDDRKGEQLMLLTSGQNAGKAEIRERFRSEGISELAVPKYIETGETIPLNGTGKIDYLKVKERALEILKARG